MDLEIRPDVHRKWRIRKTLYEMLEDRGYNINEEIKNESLHDYALMQENAAANPDTGSDRSLILVQHGTNGYKLMVYFPPAPEDGSKKIGVKPIRVFADKMSQAGVWRGILIVQHQMTPFAKAAVTEVQPKLDLEVFHESELVVNITKHNLVPQHEALSSEEKDHLLKRYKVSMNELPRISLTDPVARYLALKKGDIVRIIRPSETAGRYVTYRVCI